MLRKIFSHSILYTFAAQAPLIANIFILPLINQHLSTEDYAIFGLVMGYTGLLSGLGDLGSLALLQNAFFKSPDSYKSEWEKYLNFLNVYRILYAAATLLIIWLIFKGRIDEEKMAQFLFLVVFPIAFLDFTKTVGMRMCQWQEKHRYVYFATLISGIITICTTFFTIYILKMGFYGWFVSAFAAKMFEFIYYAYLVHIKEGIKHGFKLDFKFIGNRLKVALPLIPTKYTNYLINNSDRAVLDIYRGLGSKISLSHIGLYNIAYSFANYFSLFNNSVNSVVSPIYFKLFAKNDANASSLIRHLTLIWFFFVLGAGFILSLWLKEIMMYLYPKPEFSTAYNYSILIIMSLCYRPFMVASIDRAIYNEKTGTILKITLAGGLLNVALNFAIIPFWGIQGAVITSFITYLYIGFAGFYMKEVKKYITESYRPLLIITLLVLTSALAFTLRDIFWQHKLLVSTGVIILYYVLYRVKAKAWIQSLEALRTKN